jgi:hypothetical protein
VVEGLKKMAKEPEKTLLPDDDTVPEGFDEAIYRAGKAGKAAGKKLEQNPYLPDSVAGKSWAAGFSAAGKPEAGKPEEKK